MRILSVIESFRHGGAETVLMDLVVGLAEHEHRIVHFSRANRIDGDARFLAALARRNVPVADVHWSCLNDAQGRKEALQGFQPDLVFFHWWGNDPWRKWLRSRADAAPGRRPAFVLVMHHAHHTAPPGYDRYVLVTESQRPQVSDVPAERVRVIPNGIALGRFARRRRNGAANGRDFVVGRISSLRDGKIPAEWVDTVSSFGVPRTRYVIAGDGELRPALAHRAAALGVEDRIAFPGYVPRAKVAGTLETFDVFCYATSSAVECHPLALLEAVAAGVPIVAEARGGVSDIVEHGVNGLLAHSTDEIGEHLHHLRNDGVLHARLARGARATAERFSLARQLDRYRDLVRELAAERDGRRAKSAR